MLKCPNCQAELPLSLFTGYLGSRSRGKTSEAKKRASRLNGKKGGRPPKQKGKKR
jgi:hypothetical protein